jgi:hypothetical protein
MSEFQVNHDNYMIEAIYPYSIEVPEIITRISREITRNSTLLIKLIRLIQEDGVSVSDLDYRINRIIKKILNQLTLLETYYKTEQEEYDAINAELEDALIERDALHIKSRIKEISDEEYSIKLSVANWTVEDLTSRKKVLENILKAMDDLKGLMLVSDIDVLYRISKNNYQTLNNLKIELYTRERLIYVLSKILEIITDPRPSTI